MDRSQPIGTPIVDIVNEGWLTDILAQTEIVERDIADALKLDEQ